MMVTSPALMLRGTSQLSGMAKRARHTAPADAASRSRTAMGTSTSLRPMVCAAFCRGRRHVSDRRGHHRPVCCDCQSSGGGGQANAAVSAADLTSGPAGKQGSGTDCAADQGAISLDSASQIAATAAANVAAAPLSQEDITQRIAASRARRANRLSYNCPACTISAATPVNIARHMARCCPDLLEHDAAAWNQLESLPRGFPSPQHDAAVLLLRAAGAREMELRRRVLACVFWSGPVDPDTGLPARLEAEEAARQLGLPLARASSVLQRAMASVPLASDPGGDPLDVLYEDEHFLAVNKPVGLHTAPIHRFTGGSVVNKVIAYLNRKRGARSSDRAPVTLLTPPSAPADVPYGFLPPLMPVPGPFSLTLSANSSGSSGDDDDADATTPPATGGGSSTAASYQLEPYVLHRLDMNTSGLLLFAKRPEVVAGMHRQFRERTLSKLYVAAAVGCLPPSLDRFHVDAPIDRHPSQPVARVVAPSGKEASTSFAVLARSPAADLTAAAGGAPGLLFHDRSHPSPSPHSSSAFDPAAAPTTSAPSTSRHSNVGTFTWRSENGTGGSSGGDWGGAGGIIPPGASLVVCAPHSGRTHQIRVHLHHVGHPIVGDDIYGVTGPWLARQALHAASLRFTHPLTGREMRLAAPLHDDMAACMAALGLPQPDMTALAEEWRELSEAGGGAGAGGVGRRHKGSRGQSRGGSSWGR